MRDEVRRRGSCCQCGITQWYTWPTELRGLRSEAAHPSHAGWISKKDEVEWGVLIDQRIVAIIKHY